MALLRLDHIYGPQGLDSRPGHQRTEPGRPRAPCQGGSRPRKRGGRCPHPRHGQKLPTPLAAGRDARFPTRQALEDRLSDERLWSAKMAAVLRSLIDQAYAAEDRKWVFDKSKELRADKRPGLEEIVKDFHLYSEKDGRTDWLPELTKQGWLPVLGLKLGVIGRALGLLVYDVLIGGSIA